MKLIDYMKDALGLFITPFVDFLAEDGFVTIHARNLRRKKILQNLSQLDFLNIIFCFF